MSRRVVLYVANSLDGYIAREDGSVDWLFDPYAHGYEFFYEDVDTVIMGRKTYDQALTFEEAPYSSKRAIIFSRTAKPSPHEGLEYTSEAPEAVVRRLREAGFTNILTATRDQLDLRDQAAPDAWALAVDTTEMLGAERLIYARLGQAGVIVRVDEARGAFAPKERRTKRISRRRWSGVGQPASRRRRAPPFARRSTTPARTSSRSRATVRRCRRRPTSTTWSSSRDRKSVV